MKPRSGIERMFIGYAEELPPPREAVAKWAYRHCFKPVALWWKHKGKNNQEIWCQCCGHREPCDGWLVMSLDVWVCPECGARCNVVDRKVTVSTSSSYVSTFEVVKGVQVVRTFEVSRSNYNDRGKTLYGITELFQIWLLENGREIITTRGYDRSYNYLHWHYGVPYSIGRHNGGCSGYYEYEDTYDIGFNYIYPRMALAPYLKEKRIDEKYIRNEVLRRNDLSPTKHISAICKNECYETMAKIGLKDLFFSIVKHGKSPDRYWPSIKICNRHGYDIKQPNIWLDHIDDLMYLGLDIHSPHYACPENLAEMHRMINARAARKRAKERTEKELAKLGKEKARFIERRSRFFGLSFPGPNVTIVCIKSVDEVAEEGTLLHHCVFNNGYYKRPDSLLLSARDNSTQEPVETIELDLKTFRILQSRGHCNHDSPFHGEILSLLESNMQEIRKLCING